MHKIWLLIDPRAALIATGVSLCSLAIFIHLILWSTERYNIFEGNPVGSAALALKTTLIG